MESATHQAPPETLTIAEACRQLGIGKGLGYELARQGRLPGALRLGRRRFVVSRRLLEAFLEGRSE